MWVYDTEKEKMVLRDVTYVPGLYKIFDEILGELPAPYQFIILIADIVLSFSQRC